jgi:hypothetical protein
MAAVECLRTLGEAALSVSSLLLRGLMSVGGVLLLVQAWPIAGGAWFTQKADATFTDLSMNHPLDLLRVRDGVKALDQAVAAQPVAGRLLTRAEFLAGTATTLGDRISDKERMEWLGKARADVEAGLADAPARGLDWLRLAFLRLVIDGASREVLPPLFMSIETAPLVPHIWQARLRYILDVWPYLDDAQKDRLRAYLVRTWRADRGRRYYFAWVIYSPVDEGIVRYFLRDEPGAQEELTRLLKEHKG